MNRRDQSARSTLEQTAEMLRAPKECSPEPACGKWKPTVTQNETPKREAASSAAAKRGSNKLFTALRTKRATCSSACDARSTILLIGTEIGRASCRERV